MNSRKVLIIDDHPLVLSSIKRVLKTLDESMQVKEAATGTEALRLIETEKELDFVCLDMSLPDLTGLEFLDELRKRRIPIPVVVLSARNEPDLVHKALKAGASGYISKSANTDELRKGFMAILSTGHYVSIELRQSLDRYRSGIQVMGSGEIRLTRRQRQILRQLATGASNRDIAQSLAIAESTVKGHLVTLYAMLNTENRTGCVAEARRLGLID